MYVHAGDIPRVRYLEEHLDGEHDSEDVVEYIENLPFHRPRRDVGPLHGQRDAVHGDEDEHDEVKPVLAGQILAL